MPRCRYVVGKKKITTCRHTRTDENDFCTQHLKMLGADWNICACCFDPIMARDMMIVPCCSCKYHINCIDQLRIQNQGKTTCMTCQAPLTAFTEEIKCFDHELDMDFDSIIRIPRRRPNDEYEIYIEGDTSDELISNLTEFVSAVQAIAGSIDMSNNNISIATSFESFGFGDLINPIIFIGCLLMKSAEMLEICKINQDDENNAKIRAYRSIAKQSLMRLCGK